MAILGINLDRNNPEFTKCDFLAYMPQFTKYLATTDGENTFNSYYTLANETIFSSIFGAHWKYAMSLAIAHYLTLLGQKMQTPSGDTLGSIAGGGVTRGVMSSATIGGFSKTYDLDRSMVSSEEAKWWNLTSYGAELMALLKTKAIPSMMVVTSNPVPYSNDNDWPPKDPWGSRPWWRYR